MQERENESGTRDAGRKRHDRIPKKTFQQGARSRICSEAGTGVPRRRQQKIYGAAQYKSSSKIPAENGTHLVVVKIIRETAI